MPLEQWLALADRELPQNWEVRAAPSLRRLIGSIDSIDSIGSVADMLRIVVVV